MIKWRYNKINLKIFVTNCLITETNAQKKTKKTCLFLGQNSKTKYLIETKTANQCLYLHGSCWLSQ